MGFKGNGRGGRLFCAAAFPVCCLASRSAGPTRRRYAKLAHPACGPSADWEIEPAVRQQIIAVLKASRQIATPTSNNWVMFAAMVEAALLELGEPTLPGRLEDCVNKMPGWYAGDGAYGDVELFHYDYYNSFVIQPMLLDVLAVLTRHAPRFSAAQETVRLRAQRQAAVQERFIAPDGTFPALGRSMTYRFGAFQTLALIALRHELPAGLQPAQVRGALTAVIRTQIGAPGTSDANGWLQIGFCGHQPKLGESYISTGSLYLCSAGLLPPGLPPVDELLEENEGIKKAGVGVFHYQRS
jgi:hypothetical protein